jgi:hypothetical protein
MVRTLSLKLLVSVVAAVGILEFIDTGNNGKINGHPVAHQAGVRYDITPIDTVSLSADIKPVDSIFGNLRNVEIQDLKKNFSLISEKVNKRVLLFYFDPNRSCFTCVDTVIPVLIKFSETVGLDRVIIISKYTNIRSLIMLKTKYHFAFQAFNTEKDVLGDLQYNHETFEQFLFLVENRSVRASRVLIPGDKISVEDSFFKQAKSFVNN